MKMPWFLRGASRSATLTAVLFITQDHHVGVTGHVLDYSDTETAARRTKTFRVLRELYDATGFVAGGEQWLIPSHGKQWNFTTQAFGTDDYCMWYGVVCCMTDEGAVNALQNGAVLSAGRSAWSAYMATTYHLHDAHREDSQRTFDFISPQNRQRLENRHAILMITECPSPHTVTGLLLPGLDLRGVLPTSISQLPLQFLDVRDNPRLLGMVPTEFGRPSFWGLETKGSALNCHNNTLSDAEAIMLAQKLHDLAPEEWLGEDWSYGAQLCIEALGVPVNDEWVVTETIENSKLQCQSAFLPGSNTIFSPDYVLTYGCPCRTGTKKVFRSNNGKVVHYCRSFEFMWMIETMTFVLMVFYICGVLYRVAERKQSVFVAWVKRSCQPGHLPMEGGSLSWTEGMVGLLTRPRLNTPAPHQCYVAMCTVKDVDVSLACLEPEDAIQSLACYRDVCEKSLSQFCGWKLTLGFDHPRDRSRLLYGFHELSDALAWAIHTQHALLRAPWSADLAKSHLSQPIFHQDSDRQWRELFAGLRVSIAVSRHTITLRACLGRVLEVLYSDGMADLDALLAIANVCQIVTADDIKTLEDIKQRLAHTLSTTNHKQSFGQLDSASLRSLHHMLISMRKHDECTQATTTDVTTGLIPMIVDLGKHMIYQPSRHPHGSILNVQQLTSSNLYHQSYVTGLRPIPSICCMQPTFWQAPGARRFCEQKRGTEVVMVFTCFADYQSLYQPGMQDAAEGAVAIFKGCVQQSLDIADGYECQEVNAVFMLTFHTPTDAVKFHLVLQQLLVIADWTPEMLELPPMKAEWSEDGSLLFRGPRVKTGVYKGEPRSITPHSTTGRADYWGPLVNRAARMMAGARGGQLLCMKEVAEEALAPDNLEAPGTNTWHVLAFKSDKSVLVRRGELTTTCEPAVPYRFDQEVPEELAKEWLGTRLALAWKHLYGRVSAERAEEIQDESWDEGHMSGAEHQLNYTHEVQVHDVGTYQFKGITTDFSVKSINLAAFEGRNAGYAGGMKSGKAKQVLQGRGHERSALMVTPTPAVLLERLNWQNELQDDKHASSEHSGILEQFNVDCFKES